MAVKMYDGSDKAFTKACDKANVKPTRRQYRKWNQGRGAASNAHHEQKQQQVSNEIVADQHGYSDNR